MTTIATDGKSMVADGRATRRGTVVSESINKMIKAQDGSIIGVTGCIDELLRFTDWYNKQHEDKDSPKPTIDKNTSFLLLDQMGQVFIIEENLLFQSCSLPVAIGSGFDLAIGAMEAGASPKEAVLIACKRDTESGGEIKEYFI